MLCKKVIAPPQLRIALPDEKVEVLRKWALGKPVRAESGQIVCENRVIFGTQIDATKKTRHCQAMRLIVSQGMRQNLLTSYNLFNLCDRKITIYYTKTFPSRLLKSFAKNHGVAPNKAAQCLVYDYILKTVEPELQAEAELSESET